MTVLDADEVEKSGSVEIEGEGLAGVRLSYGDNGWIYEFEAVEPLMWHVSNHFGLGGDLTTPALDAYGREVAPFIASVIEDRSGYSAVAENTSLLIKGGSPVLGGSTMKTERISDLAQEARSRIVELIDPASVNYVVGPCLSAYEWVHEMGYQLPRSSPQACDLALWINYALRHEVAGWQQTKPMNPAWLQGQHSSGAKAIISPNEQVDQGSHQLTFSTPGRKVTGLPFTPGYPSPKAGSRLGIDELPRPGTETSTPVIPITRNLANTRKARTR